MRAHMLRSLTVLVVTLFLTGGVVAPVHGQDPGHSNTTWMPDRLSDGQPDIRGTWNNVGAVHTPLQLPEDLAGKELSQEERQALVDARSDRQKSNEWTGFENSNGNYAKAIATYQEVLKLPDLHDKERHLSYWDIGEIYLNAAKYDDAEYYLSKAIEIAPQESYYQYLLGCTYTYKR